jgi:glycosyltransferase involved in cell wall biosynthesis
MVKISFIIPALNEEKYIEKTLLSIKNQNFPKKDYEIIVSDGKSDDDTVRIAKKYTSKIVSKKNKTISDARNQGAKIAKGEILVFVDSDTSLEPSLAKSVVKTFKDKRVVGAYLKYKYDFDSILLVFINSVFLVLFFFISFFIPRITSVSGMCIIARKKSFEKINGFNPDLKTREDVDLYLRLKKIGRFVLINENAHTSNRRFKKMGFFGTIKYYLTDVYEHTFKKDFEGNYIPTR